MREKKTAEIEIDLLRSMVNDLIYLRLLQDHNDYVLSGEGTKLLVELRMKGHGSQRFDSSLIEGRLRNQYIPLLEAVDEE